ncbi:MAG TPA: FHA domain-containing serine/threonine-protein kinase [Ktedonobacteraceae bacterium]|nr:FHA domain-containing serine/threonine-protein kinase [Ktedonobacteraceae bacterium]
MKNDLLGRVINGRYKLVDERGNGNFGTVFIARDLLTNYLYAAKIMHIDQTNDSELLERFKREAYILQNLNDPHVVRLVDYGNEGSIYYIMMHHIDGQNLKWYIQTYGPMEVLRALNYIIQAAEGLDAAYKAGVAHRDIKPQNILISNKGVVKIADFGLSRSMDAPTITTSDKFMGTAYYSSPEQVQHGHDADTRSDLYSLAIVLYECLVGNPPFSGGTVIDIIYKHLHEPVPSIYRQRPDVPPQIDAFMQRAMAKMPSARYQTPSEFVGALEEIQQIIRGPVAPQLEARLVLVASGQTFNLHGQKLIVGREDPKHEIHPDIQIDDSTMTLGRKHARLMFEQGAWMVEDRNSRNKTRLNGKTLLPYEAQPLKDGDILHFGRVEARFEMR